MVMHCPLQPVTSTDAEIYVTWNATRLVSEAKVNQKTETFNVRDPLKEKLHKTPSGSSFLEVKHFKMTSFIDIDKNNVGLRRSDVKFLRKWKEAFWIHYR